MDQLVSGLICINKKNSSISYITFYDPNGRFTDQTKPAKAKDYDYTYEWLPYVIYRKNPYKIVIKLVSQNATTGGMLPPVTDPVSGTVTITLEKPDIIVPVVVNYVDD